MPDLPPPVPYQSPPPMLSPEPAKFRPTAWLAWAVILGVCVLLPLMREAKHNAALPTTGPTSLPAEVVTTDVRIEMAGKLWVGFAKAMTADEDVLKRVVGLPQKSAAEKITTAVVLAELGQRDKAIDLLTAAAPDPDAAALKRHYEAASVTTQPTTLATTAAAALPPLDRALHERYGWFARLAEVYGRPDSEPARTAVLKEAERTAVVFAAAVLLIVVAGLVGVVLFVTALVMLATGRLRSRTGRPAGPQHVYAESVAVYLGGFVGVSVLIGLLLPKAPLGVQVIGMACVVVFACLWPTLRGVPWAVVRGDWGVHAGGGLVREMFLGVVGYLAGLPVVAAGFAVTLWLLTYFQTDASHPIVQQATDSSWQSVLTLYLIAAVFAPLSEELMFRGAFVSHLRAFVGVVLAAAVSGVVFGAVHPQGWAVVPVLACVGGVFAVVRQWRGSLVGPIAAHALHNGLLITLLTMAR